MSLCKAKLTKLVHATNKDSDWSVHPHSLIRAINDNMSHVCLAVTEDYGETTVKL